MKNTYEQLMAEAIEQSHEGWDFSYIADRWHSENPPWAYGDMIVERLANDTLPITSMLDMGTGGGEFLHSLHERASVWPQTVMATEGYEPNIAVARRNLEPIGVQVIPYESDRHLPLEDRQFDLVINRHESFEPEEVMRILNIGSIFMTQQVGGQMNLGLNDLLNGPDPIYRDWSLKKAVRSLERVGFEILDRREHRGTVTFDDIGAIVWYLLVVSWQIPDFDIERYDSRLRLLHEYIQANGPVSVKNHLFYIYALKGY
ncbi:MAG: class I SAM-dependent methyltransferase [Chloroflexota bacterium]